MGNGAKRSGSAGSGRLLPAMVPAALLLGNVLLLGACGGRDPVDAPVNWWHQLEGGEIAQQRPPPPGVDAPYPKVGTTPSAPPAMLSPELRSAMTEHLIEQRNLSARLNADAPIRTPVLPVSPATHAAAPPAVSGSASAAAPPAASPGTAPGPSMSSATLDAAEAPPPPPAATEAAVQSRAAASASARPVADGSVDLAMPEIVPEQAGMIVAAGPTPPIPDAPPSAPGLPGFAAPPGPSYAPVSHPNYVLSDQPGEALQFPDGSDALSPGQDGTLRQLALHRGASGILYVHGYGDSLSDTPDGQAQALTLAVLRARAVADLLRQHGVPAGAIRIRADAFGRGARAGLLE